MKFTMVPLPMTAAEKFNEAAYFYNQMCATVNNTRIFPFNLSAFLSALRSTTFYLQVQYGNRDGFKDWYSAAQKKLVDDPVLKMLQELRREVVHLKPVNLVVSSGPKFHENPITTDHLEVMHTSDADGNIVWRYRVGRDGEDREAEPLTEWEFEKSEMSVLGSCRHGLEVLNAILRECAEWFGRYAINGQSEKTGEGKP